MSFNGKRRQYLQTQLRLGIPESIHTLSWWHEQFNPFLKKIVTSNPNSLLDFYIFL